MSLAAGDVSLSPIDLVETATHELLDGQADWGKNMQLVDLINSQPVLCSAILDALKKRLSHKKHSIGLLALTLLETLVKNCPCIHAHVCTAEFLDFFVHTLPKSIRDPHHKSFFSSSDTRDLHALERWDRTLMVLESWGKQFGNAHDPTNKYGRFGEVYRELQRKGVKFPAPDRDELAPIQTPAVRAPSSASSSSSSSAAAAAAAGSSASNAAVEAAMRRNQKSATPSKAPSSSPPTSSSSSSSTASSPPPTTTSSSVGGGSSSFSAKPVQPPPNVTPSAFVTPSLRSLAETIVLFLDLLQANPTSSFTSNEIIHDLHVNLSSQAQQLQQQLTALANAPPNLHTESTMAEYIHCNELCLDSLKYYDYLLKGGVRRSAAPSATPSAAPSPLPPPPAANTNNNTNNNNSRAAQHDFASFFNTPAPQPSPAKAQATTTTSTTTSSSPSPSSSSSSSPARRPSDSAPTTSSSSSSSNSGAAPATSAKKSSISIPKLAPPPPNTTTRGRHSLSNASESRPHSNSITGNTAAAATTASTHSNTNTTSSSSATASLLDLDFLMGPSPPAATSSSSSKPVASSTSSTASSASFGEEFDPFAAIASRDTRTTSNSNKPNQPDNTLDKFENLNF